MSKSKAKAAKPRALPQFKRGQALMIRWLDIYTRDEWASEVENKPPVCDTLGWFLAKDDTSITLASTVSGEVGWFAQVVIPIGCVTEWHEVGYVG